MEPARPLKIWAVSDGRAGIEAQALGLAEAVARVRPAEVTVKRIAYRGALSRLPTALNRWPRRALAPGADPIEPPWPDLWIAAGRASLPFSIRMRRWSGGRTFVVQTQDPRLPPRLFDLVVPPRHDGLSGDNVLPITGAPNRVTPGRLEAARARFAGRLAGLPRPVVAVLVGGRSRAFDLPAERARALAAELSQALDAAGGSLLVSFSRRTPEPARAILAEALADRPGWLWDGEGENPYFAFLAAADLVAVTEDSTTMAAEAATAGKPILVLKLVGDSARMRRFHDDLEASGAARPFARRFEPWPCEPLHETDRAAAEILSRLADRSPPP
jgi:mitochondrial fission protein ELM1